MPCMAGVLHRICTRWASSSSRVSLEPSSASAHARERCMVGGSGSVGYCRRELRVWATCNGCQDAGLPNTTASKANTSACVHLPP
eukprot:8221616-Lingulodinium_polyedra.AAC.1